MNLKNILTLFLLLFLNSCQKNVDKSENEKFEPNAYERAKEFAEKNKNVREAFSGYSY